MIMLLISITILIGSVVAVMVFSTRYWVKSISKTHFITTELSPEFREQFAHELAECSLPCKRFIGETTISTITGLDNRPIIPAEGQLLINEERCKYFSSKVFSAGLEYEQAHITYHYYLSTVFVSLGIIALSFPLVHYINVALKIFITTYRIPIVTGIAQFLAPIFNFFDTWVIAQVPVTMALMAWSEYIVAHMIVKYLVNYGTFSEWLLEYLKYQESYVSPGINQTFNISSNRKYLEQLLEQQKSE